LRLGQHQLEYDLTWRYLNQHVPSKGSILEVGAATGRYTLELAKRDYKLTAVDLSAAQIEECRKSIADEGLERQVRLVQRSIETSSVYWQEKVIHEQQFVSDKATQPNL
jgi:tRNA1(Val) A37 N6-methylase TrmN6